MNQQASASPVSSPAPAGRLRRFASMMYESVLLFGVIFTAGYLFDTLTQSRSGLIFRHERQLILFLAIGIYFFLSWRRSGQTLPMKTWNIRLVDKNGKVPGAGVLVLRYLLIWPIPLLAAYAVRLASEATGYASTDLLIVFTPFTLFIPTWLNRDGDFLHDRILGTRLVDAQRKKGV
ncbi:RDD family protein [Paracandidimonas soli]|uniref:Putative RDD family membrane protein YckC n=1 Tax=Paracandidimonas soli TaxID=1917182 RepID=A0A4R3VEV8_9BURK|nr:RDD family protein [Paracandidimonas soli]TCV01295.1 putative RDD family membrane protein YckC [Paracandidimonas soli]